jgi:hypothetical protein
MRTIVTVRLALEDSLLPLKDIKTLLVTPVMKLVRNLEIVFDEVEAEVVSIEEDYTGPRTQAGGDGVYADNH